MRAFKYLCGDGFAGPLVKPVLHLRGQERSVVRDPHLTGTKCGLPPPSTASRLWVSRGEGDLEDIRVLCQVPNIPFLFPMCLTSTATAGQILQGQ